MLTREGLKPGGCTSIYLWNETALSGECQLNTQTLLFTNTEQHQILLYPERRRGADIALIILEFAGRGVSLFIYAFSRGNMKKEEGEEETKKKNPVLHRPV